MRIIICLYYDLTFYYLALKTKYYFKPEKILRSFPKTADFLGFACQIDPFIR